MSSSANNTLPAGKRVAGYRIEGELGRGAMAVVYKAIQLNLERPVALKILADELAASEEYVIRFFNEARAAAALSHPHIVQAYDAGVTEEGICYFAMEYVEGETLLQRIQRHGYVRPGPGIELAINIADALNHGWQRQRLTHGDIKPENIMLSTGGATKLADFGLAKVAEHAFEGSDVLLTPLYAAPELISGNHAKDDCRADIYAFGATLYHTFAGSPPFPGEKAQEVMERHLKEAVEPLRERNPAVPGAISDFVSVLLSKDPAARPASWQGVLQELQAIRKRLAHPVGVQGLVAPAARLRARRTAKPATAAGRRSRGWMAMLALVVTGGCMGLLLALHRDARRPPRQANPPQGVAPEVPRSGGPADAGSTPDDPAAVWRQVRDDARAADDPARAVALLEGYAARFPSAMPPEFPGMLTEMRQAVQWRQATAAESEAAGNAAPVTSGVAGTGSTEAPETGPTEAPSPGPDPQRPRPPLLTDDRYAPIRIPMTPAERRADASDAYFAQLARLEYRLPLVLEPHVAAGNQWLLDHADASGEREQILFVTRTVLPALEEVLPKLAANGRALVGKKLPGKAYAQATVHEVGIDRLVLQEQTAHGIMLRRIEWRRQEDAVPNIVFLAREAFGQAPAIEARRPYLALLLFSRFGRLWDEAIGGLSDTPEGRLWASLRRALAEGGDTAKALAAWQRALRAAETGDRIGTHQALSDLQQTRGSMQRRYAERVGALLAQTSDAVPANLGGRLLREAAASVRDAPEQALSLLGLAAARCGDADFPERRQLETLRLGALAATALPDWLLQSVQRNPLQAVQPFSHSGSDPLPAHLPMRLHLEATKRLDGLPPRTVAALGVLQGPARLQLGDLATAQRLLAEQPRTALADLLPMQRAVVAFSQVVTGARFDEATPTAALRDLQAAQKETETRHAHHAPLVRALLAESGLVIRDPGLGAAQFAAPLTGMPDGGRTDDRRRFLFALAALWLEAQERSQAVEALQQALVDERSQREWGLDGNQGEFVRGILAGLTDPAALDARDSLGAPSHGEWHLRLLAAAAVHQGRGSEALWSRVANGSTQRGVSLGPVGGGAIYMAALARMGDLLKARDLSGAVAVCNQVLEYPFPCLFPFYARLCCLRAGLYGLGGRSGARLELGAVVGAASCANRAEKLLARAASGSSQPDRPGEPVPGNQAERFWVEWLRITAGAPNQQAANVASARQLAATLVPAAERRLAEGLVVYLERSAQAQE